MDRDFELVKLLSQLQHDNTSKFVYFTFSVTTVSIGYAISTTQAIPCSAWVLLWFLSIISMSLSLIFGIKSIIELNKGMAFTVNVLNAESYLDMVSHIDDDKLKDQVIKICQGLIKPKTERDAIDVALARLLRAELEAKGEVLGSLSGREIKERLLEISRKFFGIQTVGSGVTSAIALGNKSERYVYRQMGALAAGFLLFFAWHVVRITILHP